MVTTSALEISSRKQRLLSLSLLLILLAVLTLSGCDPVAGKYPYSSDAKWVCADPEFVLEYSHNSMGQLVQTEYLEYGGKTYVVSTDYRAHQYWVFPYNYDGHPQGYDEQLFSGTWKYVKGDLVFEIEEDYVFGGLYSELVFERVE